ASDPNPMTQERPPSRSRNSTARNSAARSPQNDRRVARLSIPGLSVATRKIAARESGAATGCASTGKPLAASGALIGSDSIICQGVLIFPFPWPITKSLFHPSLPSVRCSFFDQSRNLLRPGDVNRVTGACGFDLVALGSGGIPAFEVGVDRSVVSRYQHPARFASPRRRGDDCLEIVG